MLISCKIEALMHLNSIIILILLTYCGEFKIRYVLWDWKTCYYKIIVTKVCALSSSEKICPEKKSIFPQATYFLFCSEIYHTI